MCQFVILFLEQAVILRCLHYAGRYAVDLTGTLLLQALIETLLAIKIRYLRKKVCGDECFGQDYDPNFD